MRISNRQRKQLVTQLGTALVSTLSVLCAVQPSHAESGFSMKAIDLTAQTGPGVTAVPPFSPQNIPSTLNNFNPEAFLICMDPRDLQGGGG